LPFLSKFAREVPEEVWEREWLLEECKAVDGRMLDPLLVAWLRVMWWESWRVEAGCSSPGVGVEIGVPGFELRSRNDKALLLVLVVLSRLDRPRFIFGGRTAYGLSTGTSSAPKSPPTRSAEYNASSLANARAAARADLVTGSKGAYPP
jgi:hypothetical protein